MCVQTRGACVHGDNGPWRRAVSSRRKNEQPERCLLRSRRKRVFHVFHAEQRYTNFQKKKKNRKKGLDPRSGCEYSLYLLGPSSRQKVRVKVASSSKNSVANASHQRLSLSCNIMNGCKDVIFSTSGRTIASSSPNEKSRREEHEMLR